MFVCSYLFILSFSQLTAFHVTLIRLSYRSQIIFIPFRIEYLLHFNASTVVHTADTCDRDMCKRELFLCVLSIGMYMEHSLYCLIESNARERAVRLEFSEARYKFPTIGCAGENQIKERRTIYQ